MNTKIALGTFCREHLSNDNDWYSWREIKEDKLPAGVSLPNGTQYEKNVALKKVLNERFLSTKDSEGRKELIYYYIAIWGGIYSNSNETIDLYAKSKPEEIIRLGKKGVASWSKGLCVMNPYKYAIFDARVSASLNALQIIYDLDDKILFPILASRNRTISQGNKFIKTEAKSSNWKNYRDGRFYNEYLFLISDIAAELNVEMYTIEMLLFSKSEDLVKKAFP